MEDQIRDTLIELGYTVVDNGREFRARPIYRDSGNSSSLMVKKDNGFWIDYGSNSRGYLPELVQISLGLKDISEAKDITLIIDPHIIFFAVGHESVLPTSKVSATVTIFVYFVRESRVAFCVICERWGG